MSRHLSVAEFVGAIEGTLDPARMTHARICDTCREELAALRAVRDDAGEAVPEPSPLFWDHFSARVRAATDAEPFSVASGWVAWWRPVLALSAAVAAFALVLVMRWPSSLSPADNRAIPTLHVPEAPLALEEPTAAMPDDASLDSVVRMASDLSSDDLESILSTSASSDALVGELTPEQRQAFVTLLQKDLGKAE
jgi:hypothetical protein